MRTVLAVGAAIAAASLLATPLLTASAPAAPTTPGVAESHDGTLTVCLVGLGRHGKIKYSGSAEFLESGRAISGTSTGYSRPLEKCSTQRVEELTRIRFFYPAKAPYYLKSVRSMQTDGNDARIAVSRALGVRVLIDEGDDVKITLTYGKRS